MIVSTCKIFSFLKRDLKLMSFDRKVVYNVANLARIRVAEENIDNLATELSAIIKWVEQLNEVDTYTVQAMNNVTNSTLPQRNDSVLDGGYPKDVLANAPESVDDYFTVPKVVE